MFRLFLVCAIAAAVMGGCGVTDLPNAYDTNLDEVNRIRDNTRLTPQQRRDALAALGIDELVINAILRDQRTSNQFGGTLRTAFEKVTGDMLNEMTPDEVQLYGDGTAVTSYSDAEALAISNLFADEAILSRDDLEALLDDAQFQLPSTISEANLRSIFVTFDPNDLIDSLPA